LEERYGFDLEDVDKVNVRENFSFALGSGQVVHVPLEDMDDLARPACLACTEFANDYADTSVGGLGSMEGYTTILVRTDKGRAVYDGALRQGYIKEIQFASSFDLRGAKARMMDRVVAFARWKRERGERRRRELGVAELQARDGDLVPLSTGQARPDGVFLDEYLSSF
jgi:coenzyme F420 hydrogenase subunit beta